MKILPMYEDLLRSCDDPATLVRDARYASEKYIDPLAARLGDQSRHAAVIALCLLRLRELHHPEVARLLDAEHKARLKVLGARAAVDRAVEAIRDAAEDDD